MDVALREGDDDAVFSKSAGNHLAQITGDLSGVGFDDIHPEPEFEVQGALSELGEQHLRFGLLLHLTVPIHDFTQHLDDPARVLHRAPNWVLGPSAPYEREGDIPNTVFPCGLVHDPQSGEVRLYYGAADTTICVATARLDSLLAAVRSD